MVFSSDYELVEIADEVIAVPVGDMASRCRDVFSFSKAGASVIRLFKQDITNEELIEYLVQTYGIDEKIAREDVEKFVFLLKEYGLIFEPVN